MSPKHCFFIRLDVNFVYLLSLLRINITFIYLQNVVFLLIFFLCYYKMHIFRNEMRLKGIDLSSKRGNASFLEYRCLPKKEMGLFRNKYVLFQEQLIIFRNKCVLQKCMCVFLGINVSLIKDKRAHFQDRGHHLGVFAYTLGIYVLSKRTFSHQLFICLIIWVCRENFHSL